MPGCRKQELGPNAEAQKCTGLIFYKSYLASIKITDEYFITNGETQVDKENQTPQSKMKTSFSIIQIPSNTSINRRRNNTQSKDLAFRTSLNKNCNTVPLFIFQKF